MTSLNPSHILIARNSRGPNPSSSLTSASLSSPTETHAAAAGIFRSSGSPSSPWLLEETDSYTDPDDEGDSDGDGDGYEEGGGDRRGAREAIEIDETFTKKSRFPGTVKIVVESTTFWAHKEILFFASPFFEAALSGNWSETGPGAGGRPQSISSIASVITISNKSHANNRMSKSPTTPRMRRSMTDPPQPPEAEMTFAPAPESGCGVDSASETDVSATDIEAEPDQALPDPAPGATATSAASSASAPTSETETDSELTSALDSSDALDASSDSEEPEEDVEDTQAKEDKKDKKTIARDASLAKLHGTSSSTSTSTITSPASSSTTAPTSGTEAKPASSAKGKGKAKASSSPDKPEVPLSKQVAQASVKRRRQKERGGRGRSAPPDAVIVLKEERATTFHDFLKFVYPHLESTITWNNVEPLTHLSHLLSVPSLTQACLAFLLTHAAGKPIKAMRIAELFGEEELYRESSRFVLDNPGGWSEGELGTLSGETLLKLEKRRNWFLERVLKIGLTMVSKEYQCCPTCPDSALCARLLEEKWRQAYHAVFRFGPPQPSMVYRYLRMLEGVSPPLSLTHLQCQVTAKAFIATLFDRMFSLGTDTAPIPSVLRSSTGANAYTTATNYTSGLGALSSMSSSLSGPRRHFLFCVLKDTSGKGKGRGREGRGRRREE